MEGTHEISANARQVEVSVLVAASFGSSCSTIGEKPISEGEKVLLVHGSANRDEREFGPTADDLDVRRPIDKMLAFSYGPHHCLGAASARLQGRVALEELLSRYPDFSVDAENGRFAAGPIVRRYAYLPLDPGPRRAPR